MNPEQNRREGDSSNETRATRSVWSKGWSFLRLYCCGLKSNEHTLSEQGVPSEEVRVGTRTTSDVPYQLDAGVGPSSNLPQHPQKVSESVHTKPENGDKSFDKGGTARKERAETEGSNLHTTPTEIESTIEDQDSVEQKLIKDFNDTFTSVQELCKPFESFSAVQSTIESFPVDLFTVTRDEVEKWKRDLERYIDQYRRFTDDDFVAEHHLSVKKKYQVMEVLASQMKDTKSDIYDHSFNNKLKRAKDLLESISSKEDVEKLKRKLDQLSMQSKYVLLYHNLRETNQCFSDYAKYSKLSDTALQHMPYFELKNLNAKLIKLIDIDIEDFNAMIDESSQSLSDLKARIDSEFKGLPEKELEALHEFYRIYTQRINKELEVLKTSEDLVTSDNLEKFCIRSTTQECLRRGKNLPEIIKQKSDERDRNGMKKLINKILEIFYDFSTSEKLTSAQAKEDLDQYGLSEEWEDEVYDNFFFVQRWPQSPDKTASNKDKPPYRAYINPERGIMVAIWIFRDLDQKWRNEFFGNIDPQHIPQEWSEKLDGILSEFNIDELPKEFLIPLHASDLQADLYEHGVYQCIRNEKNEMSSNNKPQFLEMSDISYFPLKEVVVPHIHEDKTSLVVPSLFKHTASGKPSLELEKGQEDAFIGTPISQIQAFMLSQNPEKVGDKDKTREITHFKVVDDLGLRIHYYIDEKGDSQL